MILSFLISALPLLLLSMGALISQLSGSMAIYLEGLVNFAAAVFCVLNSLTRNAPLSFLAAMLICSTATWLTAIFSEKISANPLWTALALHILAEGCVLFASVRWLKIDSIVRETLEKASVINTHCANLAAFGIILIFGIFIQKSRWGLRTRITGSDPKVLQAQGIDPAFYRISAWAITGLLAGATGSLLIVQSQNFVPQISLGRGWIALAAVFLGRKKTIPVILSSLILAAFMQTATHLHTQSLVPSALAAALPYAIALVLLAWNGGNKKS